MSRTRAALALSLAVCGALYLPLTWHWPLVGDASLIHYIAFLIERGWAPYRQLGDMNMPGSFLIELVGMHVFGPGALGWRVFDFAVCLSGGFGIVVVCGRRNWFTALFAACLFVLIHGRDGLAQGGQRDLTMAACLVCATACLLIWVRRSSVAAAVGFGLLSGVAVTIKPTAVLLTVAQGLLAWRALTAQNRPIQVRMLAAATAVSWLVAPAVCAYFLIRERAVAEFVAGLDGIVPYYAGLGHRGLGYVLAHSISPIEPLVAIWPVVLLLRRPGWREYLSLSRGMLVAGVLFGVVDCIVQHRALPYYRYPLLAFLLPLIALDLAESVDRAGKEREAARRLGGCLAMAGLVFGGGFLAPQSVVLIHRYRWFQTEMLDSLQSSLGELGGKALSGRVQCIDSVSGCGTVLYRMHLEPATGVLSDFLLFGNTTDARAPEEIPVIRQTRARLLTDFEARLPEVIVVTSHLHMSGPEDYGKLARWPALEELLGTRYVLEAEWKPSRPERWWSREEYPSGYRIYVLRR